MPKTPPINDRVRLLEQQLARMSQQLEQLQRRPPAVTPPQQLFWAETLPASGESYPSSGANKLPVVPIDRDWTKEAGAETATDTPQRTIPVGISYGDTHAPEGSRVLCWRDHASQKLYRLENRGVNRGVTLGIVQSASGYHRDYTPPLPYISTNQQFDVKLVSFTETSTGSGIWQLERTDTVVKAIQVSSFPLPVHTLVMLLQPETEDAPWIAIPNISPACRWQIMAYIAQTFGYVYSLTTTYTQLGDVVGATFVNTEEPDFPDSGQYQNSSPVHVERDGLTINAPGVYRISLWGECYLEPDVTYGYTAVDIALGDTSDTEPWDTNRLYTYAVNQSSTSGYFMIPRVSTIVAIDADRYDFPYKLSVYARFRGAGSAVGRLEWCRLHVEPAAIGENQSDVGFPGWETFTTTPAPTTAPPTTAGPTTAAPTTAAPTTAAPTTAAPTTAAPTTAPPTTAGPTTAVPTTAGPPIGGCCHPISGCTGNMTETTCISFGGTWLGAGVNCVNGVNCP